MSICEPLAAEFRQESATTRRLLERVPEGKLDWKPHEKSMTLGNLAAHVAQLPSLIAPALTQDEFDFNTGDFQPFKPANVAELLAEFDRNIASASELLKNQADERMQDNWRLRSGETVFFELPRAGVVRSMVLNHIVHHRGQLSVYLRLLDVPIPSIYGPSADEGPTPQG
jgi:uncharacterized damage-inducible protein DinB